MARRVRSILHDAQALCDATLGVVELGALSAPGLRGALATLGAAKLTGAVVYSRPSAPLARFLERLPL